MSSALGHSRFLLPPSRRKPGSIPLRNAVRAAGKWGPAFAGKRMVRSAGVSPALSGLIGGRDSLIKTRRRLFPSSARTARTNSANPAAPGWLRGGAAPRRPSCHWILTSPRSSGRTALMRRLNPVGQAVGIDDKPVVLAGDLDLARRQILDRVVGAAMAVVHFGCRAAQGQRQHLMAEADAEHRHILVDQRAAAPAPRIRRSPPGRPARSPGTPLLACGA